MYVRAYLRASTQDQDAQRAREDLDQFVEVRGLSVASYYVENESGASLKRPELFRLLSDSRPGDVLLIEQVDRLSRLNAEDWEKLKAELQTRKVRVVALDLPTSHMMVKASDEMTSRMMDALNALMLDMLAAIARKDYEDRRRRTAQGVAKAKEKDKGLPLEQRAYKGRPENSERNQAILALLAKGVSWADVCKSTGASRSTLSRLKKRKALI